MSLAQLGSVPRTNADLQAWTFANVTSHRDIIAAIMAQKKVQLQEFIIQPFDPRDPVNFQAFLNAHASMHQQMDAVLGLQSYNLSEVDWNDQSQLAWWMNTHYTEHEAASTVLGVS
jgi:hypothetical protein